MRFPKVYSPNDQKRAHVKKRRQLPKPAGYGEIAKARENSKRYKHK